MYNALEYRRWFDSLVIEWRKTRNKSYRLIRNSAGANGGQSQWHKCIVNAACTSNLVYGNLTKKLSDRVKYVSINKK